MTMTGPDKCHGFKVLNRSEARDACSRGLRTLVAAGSASAKDRTLLLTQARRRVGDPWQGT